MHSRTRRQQRILDLIADYAIPSQQQLQELLADKGIEVTQATLSRDLRTLGVVNGSKGYALPEAPADATQENDRLWRPVRRAHGDSVSVGAGGWD